MSAPQEIDDILAAVQAFGHTARRVAPVHPPARAIRNRACFRVETEAGIVKARRMESEATAARQQELRRGLPAAFAPVLARFGAILIERWIDGETLDATLADPVRLAAAAALMAELHALPAAGGTALPFAGEVGPLRDFTLSGLRQIGAAGALAPPVVDRLATMVEAHTPDRVAHRLIHTDFCAENIVIDAAGRLHVIDNEDLRLGPAGMDLARSWYRWGWCGSDGGDAAWRCFREAYGMAGGAPEAFAHQHVWRIAAAVVGAVFRLRGTRQDAQSPLACLSALARGPDPSSDGDPPQ